MGYKGTDLLKSNNSYVTDSYDDNRLISSLPIYQAIMAGNNINNFKDKTTAFGYVLSYDYSKYPNINNTIHMLPSAGDWGFIYEHLIEINKVLNLIGGTPISSGTNAYYWTSSQYSVDEAWCFNVRNSTGAPTLSITKNVKFIGGIDIIRRDKNEYKCKCRILSVFVINDNF